MPGDAPARRRFNLRRWLFSSDGWPYLLAPFIPIAVGLELAHASASLIFFGSALGVIPTAALMGRATEELAARSGPGIGGLLNVTFGNAPELIIAALALAANLPEVVKASIIGSILGNVLLVMGLAMLVGGLKHPTQHFNHTAVGVQSTMLMLAVAALTMPAVFQLVDGGGLPGVAEGDPAADEGTVETLSIVVALVLMGAYALGLLFSLKTHRDLFNPHSSASEVGEHTWTVRRSVVMLFVAGALVGLMSEFLVGSIEEAGEAVGLSPFFIGVIIVAIVGNAAEHWVAVLVAYKNKMDLALNIAIGSAAQIALFVAPILVLLSLFVGDDQISLVFNGYEIAAVLLAAIITNFVVAEGESNWFEGVQLLAVYAVLGATFYFA